MALKNLQAYADALTKLAEELHNHAVDSRSDVRNAAPESLDFESGRNMAYFEVIDIFGGVADEFEIERSELGLPKDALASIVVGTAKRRRHG